MKRIINFSNIITILFIIIITFIKKVQSDCISTDELRQNMPRWVDEVPYSHKVNKTWGDIYPTDCSGFVSWALQTPQNLKSYEYGSDFYSTRIEIDDLRYGDIVTHVMCDTDQSVDESDWIMTNGEMSFPPGESLHIIIIIY